ncbi:hypothetical protein ACFZB2_39835 [Streptomyces bobili]|uniref:hypothetical protein n=1 Tax=Streptomyces bobili TaxID=67280 RepID=UPI0036E1C490
MVDRDARLLGKLRIDDNAAGFQDLLRLLAEHGDGCWHVKPARSWRSRPLPTRPPGSPEAGSEPPSHGPAASAGSRPRPTGSSKCFTGPGFASQPWSRRRWATRHCRPRGSAGSSACPSGPGAVTRPAPAGARRPEDRGRARPARASGRPPAGTRSRTWPGATARCGRCAATTATASPRRPRCGCCGCCGTRACCWRRTTSGNGASSPQGRLRDRAHRPEPGLAARLLRVRDRLGRRGTWRLAGCRDYWSKYELGWHVSPTANQHDAIAVELAIKEAELLAGKPLAELAPRDADGTVKLLVTIVTDNGGPFRSFRFEAFIATRPELRHVRTRVRTPGQNGSRERGFGSLKYEKLPGTGPTMSIPAPRTRSSPTFPNPKTCQLLDAGQRHKKPPPAPTPKPPAQRLPGKDPHPSAMDQEPPATDLTC